MTNAFDWAMIYLHFQRLLHNHRIFTIRTTIFIRLTFLQINSSILPTRKWLRKSCFISGQNQIAKVTSCWTTGGRYKMKHCNWKKILTCAIIPLFLFFRTNLVTFASTLDVFPGPRTFFFKCFGGKSALSWRSLLLSVPSQPTFSKQASWAC